MDFRCDLSQHGSELLHVWKHTVGSCHAPLALRADWQQQLRRCRSELGFRYVRFHGLLSDDVGTVVKHGDGLLYSFFNADQIIDFLLSIGMKPFVERIAKPTYRAFELLHKLGNERLVVDGLHDTVNVWVTRDNARVSVLLVNHALPRHSIAGARVRVQLAHAREPAAAWVERIDENHANAKRRWQALGAPDYLDGPAVEQLHEASRLTRQACPWTWHDGRIALEIDLPPHAVAALSVEPG